MGNGRDPIERSHGSAEVVLDPVVIEGKKAPYPGPVPPSPEAHPLTPQDLQKFAQLLAPLGVDLNSSLGSGGEIKPEKLDAAKHRVAEFLHSQIEQAEHQGAKAKWPLYFKKALLPALLRESEFPLLPKDAQISLLKEAGIEGKEELLGVLQREWADPAKRFAHFLRLQAQAATEQGKPPYHCARLFEKAASLDPQDTSLALAASRAKLDWAEETQEPQSRKVLFQQALAQIDEVLKSNPEDMRALAQKGEVLTLLGKSQEAIHLYDQVLQGKDPEEVSALPVYDFEQEKAPDLRSVRLAAAHAMQGWAERAAKDSALQGVPDVLFLEALGQVESVLEKNPRDRSALEIKVDLLTSLGKDLAAVGKPQAAERLATEARVLQGTLLRGRVEDALQTVNSDEANDREKTKAHVAELLPALEELGQQGPLRESLADWSLLAKAYAELGEAGRSREALERLASGAKELRASLHLEGAKPNAEQFENIRALIALDTEAKDMTSLEKDLVTWADLTNAAPPELLDTKAKLGQFLEIFRRMNAIKEDSKTIPDAMEAVREQVIDLLDHAEDLIPQREARYSVSGNLGEILRGVILADRKTAESLLSNATPETLLRQVEPRVQSDFVYAKALELQDPGERRAALLAVLQSYGEQKNSEKVGEILRLLETSLPFSPEDPSYLPERLKMHSAIVVATHACGLAVEEKYRSYCESEVETLRAQVAGGATGTGTPLSASRKISDLLLIRSYYEEVGDAESIDGLVPLFRAARSQGEAQLASGEPALNAKGRVELAGYLAQARALLFDSDVKQRRSYLNTPEQCRREVLEELQGGLAQWRREIAEASAADPAWQYEQVRQTLFFAASLGEPRKAGSPLLEGDALAAEVQASKDLLRPLLARGVRAAFAAAKDSNDPQGEVELQDRVLSDFAGLVDKANPGAPDAMALLVGLDDSRVSELAARDLAAHRELKKSQDALAGKDVAAWVREIQAGKAEAKSLEACLESAQTAAKDFAALGLPDRLETALQPFLDLARCQEVPAVARGEYYLKACQVFLAAGIKPKAVALLEELEALGGPGVSVEMQETARLAKGIRLMNADPPQPEEAMAIFRGLPGNETAKWYLQGIAAAQDANFRGQSFQLIQTVMLHHAAALREEGKEKTAATLEKAMGPFLREVARKLDSGECKGLDAALEQVSGEAEFRMMPDFLVESWAGNAIRYFVRDLSKGKLDDKTFLTATLGMAEYLAKQGDPYDISPELKALFEKDPKAKKPLEDFIAKLPSLKSFSHIAEALQYSTPFGVAFFSPSFSSVSKHWMGMVPGFIGGALGKYAFRSAFLAWGGSRISSAFLKSTGTFLAEESGMTVGMTFGRMGAQLLLTGKLEGLTWENFWQEMGGNLLMSLCMRGMGAGVQKLGAAASKLSWLRSPGAEGLGLAALSPAAQKALGALGYVANVAAMAGSDKAAEWVGLRDAEGLDFFATLLKAWVTNVEMGSAHAQTEVLKGILVGRMAARSAAIGEFGKPNVGDAKVPGAPGRKPPTDQDLIHQGKGFELPALPDVQVLDAQSKQAKSASKGRISLSEGDIVETGKPGDSDYRKQVFQAGSLHSLGQEPAKLPVPSAPPRSPFRETLAKDQSPQSLRARVAAAGSFFELRKLIRESSLVGAQTELRLLESCLKGETDSQRLAPGIREKALALMGDYARDFSLKLPNHHVPKLANEAAMQLPALEIRYRACRELSLFMDRASAARNLDQLLEVVQNSPSLEPEGIPKQDLLQKLQDYRDGKLGLQEMPRGFGLRQKLRDFQDAETERFYEAGQTESFPLPPNPAEKSRIQGLDSLEGDLYKSLPKSGFRGEWKSFSPLRVVETLHEVLERGKPLERITDEGGLRRRVMDQMVRVVEAAKQLYPAEWAKVTRSRRNFFTGEAFGGDPNDPALGNGEKPLQNVYRFARMLLNEKSGRPIFGMPSFPERKALRDFVRNALHERNAKDFGEAQAALRDHFTRLTPEFQNAFQRADPKTRALLVETFFGSSQHRQMENPQQAFQLAKFLAQCGMYRELGVTLEIDGTATYANISLGEYASVNPEDNRMVFVLHTHPEEFFGQDGELMTYPPFTRPGRPKTLVLEEGAQSPDTRNVVFSEADVDCFISTAEYLHHYRQSGGLADTSMIYDPQTRVFKTWVQQVHGLALMEVHLDPTGKAQEVKVRYAQYPRPGLDQSHLRQAQALRDYLTQRYHLRHDIQQVRPEEVEAGMPQ